MTTTANPQNTLLVLFEQFITERIYCSHLSPETIRGYREAFNLFIKLMPEVSEVDLLTTSIVVIFLQRISTRNRKVGRDTIKTGVNKSTIRTYWSKLNSFFEWLLSKKLIAQNPLLGMNAPRPQFNDKREIIESDIKKLYSAITLYPPNTFVLRRDTAMISLLTFTGMRLGEFISLEVRDIDFDRRVLVIRSENSKSQRVRTIPIHPTLRLHLKDYIAERNKRRYKTFLLIASSNGDRGLSRHGLKHWVKNIGLKADVKFHIHQFRHAFACHLARKNVNAVKIQLLLGHNSLNMTMSYLRSMETDNLFEDISKLSV